MVENFGNQSVAYLGGGPGGLGPPSIFFYIGKNYVLSNISKKKVEKSLKGPPSKISGYAPGENWRLISSHDVLCTLNNTLRTATRRKGNSKSE